MKNCKIQIDEKLKGQMQTLKGLMLLFINGSEIKYFCIEDFVIEKLQVTKNRLFGKSYSVEELFITKLSFKGYNQKGKFWGYYEPESFIKIIDNLEYTERDFYDLRNNFTIYIQEPINELGYKFEKIETV